MSPQETNMNKQEFMETQMFLMQSTIKNLSSEVKKLRTELRDSQKEVTTLLKKLTESTENSPEANVSKMALPLMKTAAVNGFIATPGRQQVKNTQKSNVSMENIIITAKNESANGSTATLTEAQKHAEATKALLQNKNNIKLQTKSESDAALIKDWLFNGLPDKPAGVRIILANVQKCITWKSTVGRSVFYLEKLTKWVEGKNLKAIEDSKVDLFVDAILQNYINVLKDIIAVIAKVPQYSHLNKSLEIANLNGCHTTITAYINLERAMNEKKSRPVEVIKLTSKALLEVHMVVLDQTVCWRTQQIIYFISGSTKEMDAFTGTEKKISLKDALEELSSMVKNEELESDFLSFFWWNAIRLSARFCGNLIKLPEVFEAACYNFHTASDDSTCLLGILSYLRSESTKPDSREFMINNQVTKKIIVDLTKPTEPSDNIEFYYAQLLCNLLATPLSRWEELDPNGTEACLEARRSVAKYCTVRNAATVRKFIPSLRRMLYPLFNDNESSNQLFATFLLLNRMTHGGEEILETLKENCDDDLVGILKQISETEYEEEDCIGLRILENTKQILKQLKKGVSENYFES